MKINKYFLGLAAALLFGLTSCETKVEGPIYTPMSQNVSFETAKPATVTTSETSVTIPVRVVRATTTGSLTANYTATASDEGIFSDSGNGSVTFADGEGVAIITVNANNLEKGKDYTYTLTLVPLRLLQLIQSQIARISRLLLRFTLITTGFLQVLVHSLTTHSAMVMLLRM